MKSLVKTFLVLNLVLCAVVLGVSIKFYREREIIKARTVIHREQIQRVANELKWGAEVDWEDAAERKTSAFALPDPSGMEEFESFKAKLQEVEAQAELRVAQLTEEFETLTKTQADLEETKSNLETRKAELATARGQVSDLETSLANTKAALESANTQVSDLTRDNESLQQQVDSLDKQIALKREDITEMQQLLELRTTERDNARDALADCLRPPSEDRRADGKWTGIPAKILAVESAWNFVVIDKGEADTLPVFLEAYVHRGDQYIAKLRVTQVNETISLAEVVPESITPGEKIKAGDTLFFL